MVIIQAPSFERAVKKLFANQKAILDKEILKIAKDPNRGQAKVGDLAGIQVVKFKIQKIEYLLAYRILSKSKIRLLLLAPHENFYRDLKKRL